MVVGPATEHVNLPGTIPLKMSDSPSLSIHQLPTELTVEAHEPLPSPCWNVNCLGLAQVFKATTGAMSS